LAAVVQEACSLFEPIADEKALKLNCETPYPYMMKGDIRMLQRLIANLLDNAVKYSMEKGTVTVKVARNSDQDIELLVEDTGIGIPSSEQQHIFKRFYRSDRSRSKPGTGLGLSLAEAIAKAHGGNITVISEQNKGSQFIVTLPTQNDSAP
jgi:signal transduction histidine kinase